MYTISPRKKKHIVDPVEGTKKHIVDPVEGTKKHIVDPVTRADGVHMCVWCTYVCMVYICVYAPPRADAPPPAPRKKKHRRTQSKAVPQYLTYIYG